MKQIEIIKTYALKRCLVVDDNADVRSALKRILVDFGSTDVDMAGHAEEAIELCQRQAYDIVLADYNLGKGKNGKQLLEELRFRNFLKNTAIFIMITAESALQRVVHALEFEPDDYLGKPISRESLRPRLDQALLKNEALLEVKKALDIRRPGTAIEACRKVIAKGRRFQNDAKKILGELLLSERRFEQALALYREFDAEKRPLWAAMGLAHAYFGLQHIDAAEQLLVDIIDSHHYCVDAHDLLAKVYEARDQIEQAQHTLATAVKISPMSVTRQREMGRVSTLSGDETIATHAYRSALRHSRNSCQEKPEDYIHLAASLHRLAQREDKSDNTLSNEALEVLAQVDKKYGRQQIVKIRKLQLEADIYSANKQLQKAEAANQCALETFEALKFSVVENTSTELSIDCARAFMDCGLYDAGEQLLQEVAKLTEDPELSINIDKLLREPRTREGIAYAAKLNKKGIEFHSQQQYDAAIDAFTQVLEELPNHVGLNLNFIQTLLSKHKQTPLDDREIKLIASCLKRIGELESGSSYQERYQYLFKRYQKVVAQGAR